MNLTEKTLQTKSPTGNTANSSMLFRTLDFFMLRTPLLPMEMYCSFMEEPKSLGQQLTEMTQNPLLQEAVQIASTSLSRDLPALQEKNNPRKTRHTMDAWLRYWLRMVSRPTPFGIFAGVTLGSFTSSSHLQLAPREHYRKHARPDMEWLLQIIEQLESNASIVSQLQIQASTMTLRQGSRLTLPYVTRYGHSGKEELQHDSVSVRLTPVLELVLQEAIQMIPFNELFRRISSNYSDTKPEIIQSFLLQLIEEEILITSLRPPTTVPSPLEYIINALVPVAGIETIKHMLQSVDSALKQYERTPLGQGKDLLRSLQEHMSAIVPSANPIQVDMSVTSDNLQLPASVSLDAAKAADLIWRWNLNEARQHQSPLKSYTMEFLDKYGQYRKIPLLELLDDELGLGSPAGYEYPPSIRSLSNNREVKGNRREQLLLQWMTEALAERQLEIEISGQRLEAWEGNSETLGMSDLTPLSLELYFSLTAASSAAVEAGDYQLILSPNQGSGGAGKTFGRFASLLGDEALSRLQDIQQEESRLHPNSVMAEVSYYPLKGRATNVVLAPNVRPYEIPLGAVSSKSPEETITLQDIDVGFKDGQLYLISRSLGQEVIATTGHMLNVMTAPNLCRFLLEVSQERRGQWQPFQWGALMNSPFLPRLRYERIVLSPARWKWINEVSKENKSIIDAEWPLMLKEWRNRWMVPQHVYLTQADHRILLDLEQALHSDLLRKEIEKHGTATLVEIVGDLLDLPVEGTDGRYIGEFVFPLVRNKLASIPNPSGVKPAACTAELQDLRQRHDQFDHPQQVPGSSILPQFSRDISLHSERSYLPGSKWLYFKLYGNGKRQEELIGRYVMQFMKSVVGQGLAELCYFIRYQDPEHHLRIRIQSDPERIGTKLIPLLHQWSSQLQQEGMLSRLVIDTYEPEIERYGGMSGMRAAEVLFSADSVVSANFIAAIRFGRMSMELNLLAVVSIIDIMNGFGLSHEQQFDWLNLNIRQQECWEEFRQYRSRLLQYLKYARDNTYGWTDHQDGPFIDEMLQLRRPALLNYVSTLHTATEKTETEVPLKELMASVIHMHLNRLLGTNREREQKVMVYTRHSLHCLIEYNKNKNTK
ncbi:lantibiotic dehydratase [Paenibacillus sp. 22594]